MTRKRKTKIFAVVMVLLFAFSAVPAFAADINVEAQDLRIVHDLITGERRVVDLNSTDEEVAIVNVSLEESSETSSITPRASRYYEGKIIYEITYLLSEMDRTEVQCYQTQTVTSNNGYAVSYSHLWDFVRVDSGLAYGATYTMYGDLGTTTYTNGVVTSKNFYSPENWGIISGSYALANNFFSTNPEYFAGSSDYTSVVFVYV